MADPLTISGNPVEVLDSVPYAALPTSDANVYYGQQFLNALDTLQVGFGSKVLRVDQQGIWLGAANFASAPFSVDMAGNVKATSMILSGYIPTGGAASDVNSGGTTVNGGKLTAGSVTTDKLIAGEIMGFTITGGLFRTATSGQRIEMQTSGAANQIRFYDSSTLYGSLTVTSDGTQGQIKLVSESDGGGFILDTGVGASGFSGATMASAGGTVFTNGNASNGFVGFTGKNNNSFYISGGPTGDTVISEIDLVPSLDASFNLGSSSKRWSTIYALTISGLTTLSILGTTSTASLNVNSVPVPRFYHGYCSGTTISKSNSNPFSVSQPGTGRYTFTHNWGSTNYTVQATALRATGSGAYSAKVSDLSLNSFEITIFDDAGNAQNSDFMYVAFRN